MLGHKIQGTGRVSLNVVGFSRCVCSEILGVSHKIIQLSCRLVNWSFCYVPLFWNRIDACSRVKWCLQVVKHNIWSSCGCCSGACVNQDKHENHRTGKLKTGATPSSFPINSILLHECFVVSEKLTLRFYILWSKICFSTRLILLNHLIITQK